MLVLIFAFDIFFWLTVGAVQYVVCLAVPRLRRYALSAALWWAIWGPCSVGLIVLAGLAIVAQAFITRNGDVSTFHAPHLPISWWGYVIVGAIVIAAIATCIAWLHQAVVRRFTFALFRLYATAVSAGVGSVFGWCFCGWTLHAELRYGWVLSLAVMLVLIVGFGFTAFRNSRALRGDVPTKFAWVSRQEFEGT
jgi:hypothetical protein